MDSNLPREEVFITTKLWNSDHGQEAALRAFETSLRRLGLEYVDLYLIHFPVPRLRGESWRVLEKILSSGKARALGVSNYTERHLNELLGSAKVVPAINQVEFSPFLYQRDLLAFCRTQGIQLEAYAPLTAGQRLRDPRITAIAGRHGRTNAQVLLRWAIQHEVVVIPKSRHADRIEENARIFDFELTREEVAALDGLNDGFRSSWDPTAVP
jgi:diketogulonate reductase-like aldo/keto reductase